MLNLLREIEQLRTALSTFEATGIGKESKSSPIVIPDRETLRAKTDAEMLT